MIGGWPTRVRPPKRLPHPSRFSTGGNSCGRREGVYQISTSEPRSYERGAHLAVPRQRLPHPSRFSTGGYSCRPRERVPRIPTSEPRVDESSLPPVSPTKFRGK